jgi:hypothetical protein
VDTETAGGADAEPLGERQCRPMEVVEMKVPMTVLRS